MEKQFSKASMKALIKLQKAEINGHYIYKNLAKRIKVKENSDVLKRISDEELIHYGVFKAYTKKDVKASRFTIFFYTFISIVFGLTFGVKLLEKGERNAVNNYEPLVEDIPEIKEIIEEEENHEMELIGLLNEERLSYMSSVVLGLNDALVELTGALAGFTLSIQHSRTIALLGIITGISASLSMAASEYLSTKTEEDDGEDSNNPLKASIYTGVAYIITVTLLVLPFLFITNYVVSLGVSIGIAVVIIAIFNYYISVAKDYSFKKRFFGMAFVSLSVAAISFLIGYLVKRFIGIDL